MSAPQLALNFPALARDPEVTHVDVVSQAAARRALSKWAEWPGGTMALIGPENSGKTHLATLWARAAGARIVAPVEAAEVVAAGVVVLEDADRIADEGTLLAWLEAARSGAAVALLLTARAAPTSWPVALPDLRSRLALTPVVMIEDPTDDDLSAVFAKVLADRGADASPASIRYVVTRIERSFAAAADAAARLDRAALERKQKVTRALATSVLGAELGGGADDGAD